MKAADVLRTPARLAELEAGLTIEKAKVETMKARLFGRLRAHFQRRDRLRLVIGYRRKYLESLMRQGEDEAGKIAQEIRQANTQQEQEYAETAAVLAEDQALSAEEVAEVSQLWRKLVRLFHPDSFAHDPEKQMGWGKFEMLNYELSPMALDETFARGFVHELEILRLRSVPAFARDGTPLPMNLPHLQRRSASWARQERRASSRRPTARAAVKALNLSKGAKLSRWAHRTPPPSHMFVRLRRSRQSAAGSSPLLCTSPGSSRTKYHARVFGSSGSRLEGARKCAM